MGFQGSVSTFACDSLELVPLSREVFLLLRMCFQNTYGSAPGQPVFHVLQNNKIDSERGFGSVVAIKSHRVIERGDTEFIPDFMSWQHLMCSLV